MVKKEFEVALGNRAVDTGNADELVKQAAADSQRKRIERAEEISEAEHHAKIAKLKKDAAQAEASSSNTGAKKDSESPVKFEVKGGVNLGEIDFAEERMRAAKDLKQMKEEQENNLRSLGSQNEALRDKIHEKEMQVLQLSFQSQMDILNKMIESNSSKGDFSQQLAAARAVAQELGYSPAPAGGGNGGNLEMQLKIKEMEFNNSVALRKLDEEAKDRDIQRKIDLQKLEDDRAFKKMEADRQAKRDEFFASFPEFIGRGFGKAYAEANAGSGEIHGNAGFTSKQKEPQPGIVAGVGEAGEANCSNCGQVMAIGPKSEMAVCAGCGAKYPIKRVEQEAPPPQDEIAEDEQ